jgi:MFS family permease
MGDKRQPRLVFTLCVLLGINLMNFFDRQVLGAVAEPLKKEWSLTDTQLGWLATAFTLLYAVVGLPLGRWADVGRRTTILSVGVLLWSLLTAASGLARGFASLFIIRLGVGVGEASCAPAANSLLADLFPVERRARAVAVFMLGLPLGLALSFLISGEIAALWGWRGALFVAAVPGFVLGLLVLAVPEPKRESRIAGIRGDPASGWQSFLRLLRWPCFWFIVLSGTLHNFNAYALGQFLSPFLIRYHGLNVASAGRVAALLYGCGGLGALAGGWACDRIVGRRASGRLEVTALALLVFVPCMLLALQRPAGDYWGFSLFMIPGVMLSYVYYAGVYATLQDIVEPSLRGIAMAFYFCAMYLLGASLGPVLTGRTSDWCARLAAHAQGRIEPIDVDKATGLYHAMYVVPALGAALVVVLLAAAWTLPRNQQHGQAMPSQG